MRGKLLLATAAGLAGSMLLLFLEIEVSGQQNSSPKVFGGTFTELAPEQQRLLRDWTDQYSKLTGKKADPAQLYDSARMSQRTTFDAVTHALLHTALTDSNSQPMGAAFAVITGPE